MKKLQRTPVARRLVLERETVRVHVVERSGAALGLVRGGAGEIVVLEPQTSTTTTQQ